MIKKYYQFLKLNEDVDLFADEEWDFEEEQPEEPEEMVEDYSGHEILKSEAVECEDGSWCHEDEVLWSEYDQVYITPYSDDYIWVEGGRRGGDYMHREDLTWSDRDSEYYLMDDAVWCDHEDDACLWDDAIECEDGEFAFRENVVEDSEGKTRHTKDVTYNEETEEYDYTG